MVHIIHGLPAGMEAAAALYWEAFGAKLGKLLGPAERAERFFAETINHSSIFAAVEGSTLLGIAAFKDGEDGFCSAGLQDMLRHYGLGALWKMIPLSMLERSAPEATLQMDGICVSAAARGKGVGSSLIKALYAHGKAEGLSFVTLDVIDTNPRAKALYEAQGFVTISVESTSILRPLLDFSEATKMRRPL